MRINKFLFLGWFFFAIWGCSKSTINSTTNKDITIPSNIADFRPTSGDSVLQLNSVLQLTLIPYDQDSTYKNLYYYVLGPTDTLYMYIINGNPWNTYVADTIASIHDTASSALIWVTSSINLNSNTTGDFPNTTVDFYQFMFQDVSGTLSYGAQLGQFSGTQLTLLPQGYSLTAFDTLNLFGDPRVGALSFADYNTWYVYNTPTNFFLDAVGYISFRIRNNKGSRYGWIKASSYPENGTVINIYEIAFNKNYNVPIAMGGIQVSTQTFRIVGLGGLQISARMRNIQLSRSSFLTGAKPCTEVFKKNPLIKYNPTKRSGKFHQYQSHSQILKYFQS